MLQQRLLIFPQLQIFTLPGTFFLAPGIDRALGNIHLRECKGMIHLSKGKHLLRHVWHSKLPGYVTNLPSTRRGK